MNDRVKGRFAPSPSGRMHMGNVYSALFSWLSAKAQGGEWLLRIEDLDRQRCHREYALQIEDDLRWLGLHWDEGGTSGGESGPYFQSERDDIYNEAFERLEAGGLLYPCYCSRADLRAASAPHASDGVVLYSGRCRTLSEEQREQLAQRSKPSYRFAMPEGSVTFEDKIYGRRTFDLRGDCGDFVVRRADGNYAYQLAVVVDDALMGVTEVVRGSDLLSSTPMQMALCGVLGYEVPSYMHLPMLVNSTGQRLSKRDASLDMGILREQYKPQELIGHLLYLVGIISSDEPLSAEEALQLFSPEKMPTADIVVG